MKQSLKYALLLVLFLITHTVNYQTMENNIEETTPTYSKEECFVSQDYPIHKAIELLYNYHSNQSCDINYSDVTQVPIEKSIQLFISYLRGHKQSQIIHHNDSYHVPKYLSDPITHYIYGLRKIII